MQSIKKFLWTIFMGLTVLGCCLLTACGEGSGNKVKLYDGGTLVKEANVAVNQTYEFGVPDKFGYAFLGWYSEESGGSSYTDEFGSSAGMTWKSDNPSALYAHWEAKKYILSLDYCGATALNTVTELSATYDRPITDIFPVPQKTSSSFLGWFTKKEGGKQITDETGKALEMIYNAGNYPIDEKGTTLYAQWGAKKVTYSFFVEGQSAGQATYDVGATLYELPVPAQMKDNHCFKAWCFDSTYLSEISFPFVIPDSSENFVTLYAKFEEASINELVFTTYGTGDREYEVSYVGSSEKIVIPDTYYGKKVTRVRSVSSSAVREIILPQTITEFVAGAFKNCSALEKINIPYAVKELPKEIFSGCVALQSVVIPAKTETIGTDAFAGCTQIESISLSQKITEVGSGAFRDMSALTAITVAEGNESYLSLDGVLYSQVGNSRYLVQYPAAKTGDSYAMDAATVKISDYAFSGSRLTTITVGGKINSVGKGAFEGCKYLVSASIDSEAISFTINEGAFKDCSNFKALKINRSKEPTLRANAFVGVADTFSVYVSSNLIVKYETATNWNSLKGKIFSLGDIIGDFAVQEVNGGYAIRQYFGTKKEVMIPEILNAKHIVGIADNAFSLSDVEKVTVSQYVTEIGSNAFKNCAFLQSIIMDCDPPTLGEGAFTGVDADFAIYVKGSPDRLDAYRAATGWSVYNEKIWSLNG